MRKVLPMSRIREMEPYMDAKVLDYIHEGQIDRQPAGRERGLL